MEDYEKIELRSEEFREILGTPPRWIVQYGTTFAVIGFFIVALFSYFFTYPDIVKASVNISTEDPPVSIIAEVHGYLEQIVPEHSMVQAGDILAILRDDGGNPEDILALDLTVKDLEGFGNEFSEYEEEEDLVLGSVGTAYKSFIELHKQHQFSRVSSFKNENEKINRLDLKVMDIEAEMQVLRERIAKIEEQIDYYEGPYKAKLKEFYATTKSTEAYNDLLDRPQKVLSFQRDREDAEKEIRQLERDISDIRAEQMEVREGFESVESNKGTDMRLKLFALRDVIDKWKTDHLIIARISGKVYYTDLLKSGEELAKKDARIMAIVPPNAEEQLQGKLYVNSIESGKIKMNQPVNIQFQAFPSTDYGLLEGKVIDKAAIPNAENGKVFVKVGLENLVMTSGDTIPFEYDMQGYAHIITENRPLLFRFFDYFLKKG